MSRGENMAIADDAAPAKQICIFIEKDRLPGTGALEAVLPADDAARGNIVGNILLVGRLTANLVHAGLADRMREVKLCGNHV